MSKKAERLSERIKRAYKRGYIQGFDDNSKLGKKGNRFWGSRGYWRGYGDKTKVNNIQKRYNKYRESK